MKSKWKLILHGDYICVLATVDEIKQLFNGDFGMAEISMTNGQRLKISKDLILMAILEGEKS